MPRYFLISTKNQFSYNFFCVNPPQSSVTTKIDSNFIQIKTTSKPAMKIIIQLLYPRRDYTKTKSIYSISIALTQYVVQLLYFIDAVFIAPIPARQTCIDK